MKDWKYYQISQDGDLKNWINAIKHLCTVTSSPELLYTLDECRRSGLASMGELCFFKENIKPMWEDTANVNGGRCNLEISANDMELAMNCWKRMVALCYAGGIDAINGCIFSEKASHYRIGVWISDDNKKNEVMNAIKEVLGNNRVSYSYTLHNQYGGGGSYKSRGGNGGFSRNK